jgi:hypothetical protein
VIVVTVVVTVEDLKKKKGQFKKTLISEKKKVNSIQLINLLLKSDSCFFLHTKTKLWLKLIEGWIATMMNMIQYVQNSILTVFSHFQVTVQLLFLCRWNCA